MCLTQVLDVKRTTGGRRPVSSWSGTERTVPNPGCTVKRQRLSDGLRGSRETAILTSVDRLLMHILVTGGAGFLGSNFIRHVLETYPDYQVTNFDKLTYAGNLENLKDVQARPQYQFVQGDIADPVAVEAVVRGQPDAIVNYAAETHVDRSILNPRDFVVTDIIGTLELLEAARHSRVSRFIQISTDEVYGQVLSGTTSENAQLAPRSPYAASKAGADQLVLAYAETYQLPTIVTRACNIYGPYQFPEKLIPLFITNLIDGKPIPLYGDGRQEREWLYVDDHCRAIDAVLHHGRPGQVYNIGTGEHRQNLELTHWLLTALGRDASLIHSVADRPGHDRRYALDSRKIRQELGWQPQVSLAQGLRETVAWYQRRQDWWRPMKAGQPSAGDSNRRSGKA